MELRLDFEYPASASVVYQTLISPAYRAAAVGEAADGQRVVREDDDGARQERVVEISGPGFVPGPIAKLLRIPPLTFRLEETYTHAERAWVWRLRPSKLEARISISGTERLTDTADGSTRTIELSVQVRMALVGARAEKMILESLRSSIATGVEFDHRWLTSGGDAVRAPQKAEA
ncbi:MAG: DUF2505 family protein [Kofleriaceae bacterium]